MGKCLSCCFSARESRKDINQEQVASGLRQHEAVLDPQDNRLFISCKVTSRSLKKRLKSSRKEKNGNLEKSCVADLPPPTGRGLFSSQKHFASAFHPKTESRRFQKREASLGIKRVLNYFQPTTITTIDEKSENFIPVPVKTTLSIPLKSSEILLSSIAQLDGITSEDELRALTQFHPIDEITPHLDHSEILPKIYQDEASTSHPQILTETETSTSQKNPTKPSHRGVVNRNHPKSTASIIFTMVGLYSFFGKHKETNGISQKEESFEEPQDNIKLNTQDKIQDSLDSSGNRGGNALHSSQATKNKGHHSSVINKFISKSTLSSLFKKKEKRSGNLKNQSTSVSHGDDEVNPTSSRNRYVTAQSDTEKGHLFGHKASKKTRRLSLPILIEMVDDLHLKSDSDKQKGFELLCNHKNKYKDETEFMWRLVRAYGDMCELSTNMGEKKKYASDGKDLGERAVSQAPKNGYCHLWYGNLCGLFAECGGLQNRVKYGHLFKEHLDKAIELIPDEPLLYYLNGRYCYSIFKLNWMEKKMASTLFGVVPTSSIEDALSNFLKAEELKPGFSKFNYVYLAKCYKELGDKAKALTYCDAALLVSSDSTKI
ncbi:regulator of microtubule dynamics protein 2 isoform X2 [Antechinus flavipes]|uniref:regulator of microtubule dynamics protein 2 isoform X2 n=1 Tax=Antechinus flavipes TaxID=38775 RepID=UPI0022359C09|nr:regulator of microtubule dynamics protein 2 isoform X2 [Antechinus flavipes]